MYLNETILQSRTTLSLVEFIDELCSHINWKDIPIELIEKYDEIKRQTNKAVKKRNFK